MIGSTKGWSPDNSELAFGPAHAESLLRTINSARTLSRVANVVPYGYNLVSFLDLDQRHQLAIDWLTILQHRGHDITPLLLESGETNIIGIAFTFYDQERLNNALAKETNPALRYQLQ